MLKKKIGGMKTKISFDFDNTLDLRIVQDYAKILIKDGLEVWIITSRYNNEEAKIRFHTDNWNEDLFKAAKELGIPNEQIIFTNMELKADVIEGMDLLWHLDDDSIELEFINDGTQCIGVERGRKNDWRKECETIIKNNKKDEEKT